jgi:putative SOS response-associated peptidase YedK
MEVPVLVAAAVNDNDHNHEVVLEVQTMKWGLIPRYSSSSSPPETAPNHFLLFNKRIESFLDASHPHNYFYRLLLQHKRCVVIFDGFYEWHTVFGDSKKHPYYVHRDDNQPLMMAGIFEDSRLPKASKEAEVAATTAYDTVRTFSILTTEPDEHFLSLHDRQPVCLSESQARHWLDCSASSLSALLQELADNPRNPAFLCNQRLIFHPVTKRMSDSRYQGPDCSVPLSLKTMESFFQLTARSQQQQEQGEEKTNQKKKSFLEMRGDNDTNTYALSKKKQRIFMNKLAK